MAIKSGFFNSINHDRKYDAESIGEMFNGLFSDGIFKDAVIRDGYETNDKFEVTANGGFHLLIGTGKAWFNKIWVLNDTKTGVMLSNPHLILPRIDAVALEIDKSDFARDAKIVVVQGMPAANPERPTMLIDSENKIYQYALAYVTVPANASEIIQSNIESAIGTTETPYAAYLGSASVNIRVANSLDIIEPGWILDARQGKVLGDRIPFRFGTDANGKYGYYRNSDGQFVPFLGTSNVIKLGSGTRFDLTSYPDYKQFTIEKNFFFKNIRARANHPHIEVATNYHEYDKDYSRIPMRRRAVAWINDTTAIATPYFSYDANNGILTVNGASAVWGTQLGTQLQQPIIISGIGPEEDSRASYNVSVSITYDVYLIH